MADGIIEVGEGFWNIRGSFKIAGVVDIGTQASLVRLGDGRFVLLDAYTLSPEVEKAVRDLTDGGKALHAVIHLHPFHTIHVKKVAAMFPEALQYGSARHAAKAPELTWAPERVDDPAMHALFAEDLEFTVPRGVDFISDNENVHFSSVLAFHRASSTLHVDDTVMFTRLPIIGGVGFHPTLKKALEKRAGAAADFRAWALELADACQGIENLCAAHTRPLLGVSKDGPSLPERVRAALKSAEKTLAAHEKTYGA